MMEGMYDSGDQCTITPHSSSNQIFVIVDMSVGLTLVVMEVDLFDMKQ